MTKSIKVVTEEKDIGNELITIALSDDNKNGIYIPYSACIMLEKLLDDLYIEKFSTENKFSKKKYDFLFYIRRFINTNVLKQNNE